MPTPAKKYGLIKGLLTIIVLNNTLIRPYFLAGWYWGNPVEDVEIVFSKCLIFLIKLSMFKGFM